MATDLIDRAQAGDGQAFRQLVEPYEHELQVRLRAAQLAADLAVPDRHHPQPERAAVG
jgi:hypothetical protein